MAAKDKTETTEAVETPSKTTNKTKSQCPRCKATRFQRHERGGYADGKFVLDEVALQCLGCLQVFDERELVDVPVL